MICNSLNVQLDQCRDVTNEAGQPYAIVHQFDRFDAAPALVYLLKESEKK